MVHQASSILKIGVTGFAFNVAMGARLNDVSNTYWMKHKKESANKLRHLSFGRYAASPGEHVVNSQRKFLNYDLNFGR
jgi:hypothetical protein